jgi:hypothetical protein
MATQSKPLNPEKMAGQFVMSGYVDHIVGGMERMPTGRSLNEGSFKSVNASQAGKPKHRFSSTIEAKTYSLAHGYQTVTGGKHKKKKNIIPNMAPGHRRENLSEIDKDYIEGAEYKFEFDAVRSSMVRNVKYDAKKLLMRVEFVNRGDVVIYDHVPAETYFYLKFIADRDGHVGKVFWDVVRYRGQNEGSKFPYWYEFKSSFFDDPAFASLPQDVKERLVNSKGKEREETARKLFEEQGGIIEPEPDKDSIKARIAAARAKITPDEAERAKKLGAINLYNAVIMEGEDNGEFV